MEKPRSLIVKKEEKKYLESFEEILRNPDSSDYRFVETYKDALSKELPKTEFEINIIKSVNENIDAFARKYINETWQINESFVHKIQNEEFKKMAGESSAAFYVSHYNQIFIKEAVTSGQFFAILNHEMLHAKSYSLFQKPLNNLNILDYRNGVSFFSRKNKIIYLTSFNEGITELLNKKIVKKTYEENAIKENIEDLSRILNHYRVLSDFPILDSGDVYSFEKIEGLPEAKKFSYPNSRMFLDLIIEDILKKGIKEYKTKEDVEDLFARSYFTGSLVPLVRVIDETYGEGTFKNIAKIDSLNYEGRGNPKKEPDVIGQKLQSYILGLRESNK